VSLETPSGPLNGAVTAPLPILAQLFLDVVRINRLLLYPPCDLWDFLTARVPGTLFSVRVFGYPGVSPQGDENDTTEKFVPGGRIRVFLEFFHPVEVFQVVSFSVLSLLRGCF